MQLNYFGCLRLIMGFMPTMVQRRKGHIINISSIGVLANSPRFSAYVASKAALDAYQDHPDHIAIKPFIGAVREARQCMDYEI
jgi:short-subunit dehydrogenase